VPGNLDSSIYDEVIQVTNEDAIATTRRLAREDAIFAGISSVSVVCDFGERYLSNPVYAELPEPDFSDVEDALEVPARS
jgi:cysteine synthase A